MGVRVIFSGCSIPLYKVALKLKKTYGWEICYITGNLDYILEHVKTHLPDTIYQSVRTAYRGIVPKGIDIPRAPVDKVLLEDFALDELIVLHMIDRVDAGYLFNHQERVRLYHNMLIYWLGVLEHCQPDFVVFHTTPHEIYDYVLYALCQYKGIKTMFFQPTAMPNLLLPLEKINTQSAFLLAAYGTLLDQDENVEPRISARSEDYIQKIMGSYEDGMSPAMKIHFQAEQGERVPHIDPLPFQPEKKNRELNRWYKMIRPIIKPILPVLRYWYPIRRNYLRLKRFLTEPIELLPSYKRRGKKYEEQLTKIEHILARIKNRFRPLQRRRTLSTLRTVYESHVQEVSLDTPYIYVPLHYQPEKTTSPEGGVFVSQRMMVDLLSKCIPPNWLVYVKEHPVQLSIGNRKAKGHQGRIPAFYDDIAALPNVKLISLAHDSFVLIDHAQAVATVTGTTGWEAVIRGKPALIFGHAWYKGCEGVFEASTETSCRQALARIQGDYAIDRRKVFLFLQALEQVGIVGYTKRFFDYDWEITDDDNVNTLTQAILWIAENNMA
jgi:hypothetical protein